MIDRRALLCLLVTATAGACWHGSRLPEVARDGGALIDANALPDRADGGSDGVPADSGPTDVLATDAAGDSTFDATACVCDPGTTKPCGPCLLGQETCRADCQGYAACEVPDTACKSGSTEDCLNGCGTRQCKSDCQWGDCSTKDQYVAPAGKLCWSSNHCGSDNGRCVQCWLKCAADGSLYEDGWCAGGNCTPCYPESSSDCPP